MPACSRCLVEVFPGTAAVPELWRGNTPDRPPEAEAQARREGAATGQRAEPQGADLRPRHPGAAGLVLAALVPASAGPFSVHGGLSAHGWLFIAVLDSIVLVLYVLITAFGAGDLADMGRLSKEQLLTVLTGVNLVLVCWRSCSSRPASAGPTVPSSR